LPEAFELHLQRVLDKPYEQLEADLRAGPEKWLPGFQRKGDRITSELGYVQAGAHIKRRTEVQVGPVQRFAYGVTVQIGWKGARHPGLYPELEGHLRLERRQPSGSVLRLDARYTPPAGRIGATVDRALMHRVAESSVRDFLDRVTEILTAA
jgi:hypothetical protein